MSLSKWKQRLRLAWSVLTGSLCVREYKALEEEASIYKSQCDEAVGLLNELRTENMNLRRDTLLVDSQSRQIKKELDLQVQINLHMKDALEEARGDTLEISKDYDSLETYVDDLEEVILDMASEMRKIWEGGSFPFPTNRSEDQILDWMEITENAITPYAQLWAMEKEVYALKAEDQEE